MIEWLKIVVGCVLAAVFYGILHDQITARICLEYFTVFHPPVFPTQDPTWLALGWGVLATWWVGLLLGIPLASVSRLGKRPKLVLADLMKPITILLGVMAVSAFASGLFGYLTGTLPEFLKLEVPSPIHHRFAADLWAHNTSYFVGCMGGIVLCVLSYKRRGMISK